MDPVCPSCMADAVVEDYRNRSRVCVACGMIVEEIVDEWQQPSFAEPHAPTRASANPDAAATALRLKRMQQRIDSDLISSLALREFIDDSLLRSNITIPGAVVDYTVSMFWVALAKKPMRGDARRGLIGACLKQILHERGTGYDTPTVAFIFDTTPQAVSHGTEHLASMGIGSGTSQDSVEFLARSIANRMGLDAATVTRVSDVALKTEPLMRTPALMASRPRTVAASCVWIILDESGKRGMWSELELASGVARTTFTAIGRKIKDCQAGSARTAPVGRVGTAPGTK